MSHVKEIAFILGYKYIISICVSRLNLESFQKRRNLRNNIVFTYTMINLALYTFTEDYLKNWLSFTH